MHLFEPQRGMWEVRGQLPAELPGEHFLAEPCFYLRPCLETTIRRLDSGPCE